MLCPPNCLQDLRSTNINNTKQLVDSGMAREEGAGSPGGTFWEAAIFD